MRAYKLPKGGAGIDALVVVGQPEPKPSYHASSKPNTLSITGLTLLAAMAPHSILNICVEPTEMPHALRKNRHPRDGMKKSRG